MAKRTPELTTTTYAVLGLLCIQPWSAYELTQQMARSLRFFWPRAESGIYREPQKLVQIGYATATESPAGPQRTKTVYSATPAGRRALRRWLRTPSQAPGFESEVFVKFFFADQGTRQDAVGVLQELESQAQALNAAFRAITASYHDSPGPFPERLHVGSLIGRFLYQYGSVLSEWAHWAKEHVSEWPTTGPQAAGLGRKVQDENAALAARPDP